MQRDGHHMGRYRGRVTSEKGGSTRIIKVKEKGTMGTTTGRQWGKAKTRAEKGGQGPQKRMGAAGPL
jgi:hypothetical protein